MLTFSAKIMWWAPPKLHQLWCDPLGEPEVLIPQDKGTDIEQAAVKDCCFEHRVHHSPGKKQSNSVTVLWCLFARILPHLVVFGLTIVWNELANCKKLCLNSVNHRTAWKMLMVCFSSLSAPRAWESGSRYHLPLWRLRRLRLPGALPRGQPVKRRDEVIMGLVNSPLAFYNPLSQGDYPRCGVPERWSPIVEHHRPWQKELWYPLGKVVMIFKVFHSGKGACDLWSKTNLLVGSCSMKWDKVW